MKMKKNWNIIAIAIFVFGGFAMTVGATTTTTTTATEQLAGLPSAVSEKAIKAVTHVVVDDCKTFSESIGNATESVGKAIETTANAMAPLTGSISEKAAASVDKIIEYVAGAEDFVVTQAPLVVQEIWHWGMAEHVIYFIVFIVLGIVTYFISNKCFQSSINQPKGTEGQELMYGLGIICRIATVILPLIGLMVDGMVVAKIYFAPRIYLLEVLPEIVKNILP